MRPLLYFVIMIAASFSVFTPRALAQEVFLKKDKETPEGSADQTSPEEGSIRSMSELANVYYQNCLQQENDVMSAESQQMLCACTAAKMTEEMTVEDMAALFTQTEEGAFQRERVIAFIYAPCMEHPVHDLVYKNCVEDSQVSRSFRNKAETCGCLAQNMAEFTTKEGSQIVMNEMRRHAHGEGNAFDPLKSFFDSRRFINRSQHYASECVKRHEFGLP